jgi:superfamily II DNA/RNA helicase
MSSTFSTLGLSPKLINAAKKQAIQEPYPIQTQAIPAILEGKDVLAASQTGTGKTAAYILT